MWSEYIHISKEMKALTNKVHFLSTPRVLCDHSGRGFPGIPVRNGRKGRGVNVREQPFYFFGSGLYNGRNLPPEDV